jgi:hypothetical protein
MTKQGQNVDIDIGLESEAVKCHILFAEYKLKTIYHRSPEQIELIYSDAARIADAAIAKLKPGEPVDSRDGVILSVAYSGYLNYACTYLNMFADKGKNVCLPKLKEKLIPRFVSVFYGCVLTGDIPIQLEVSSEEDGAGDIEDRLDNGRYGI